MLYFLYKELSWFLQKEKSPTTQILLYENVLLQHFHYKEDFKFP